MVISGGVGTVLDCLLMICGILRERGFKQGILSDKIDDLLDLRSILSEHSKQLAIIAEELDEK